MLPHRLAAALAVVTLLLVTLAVPADAGWRRRTLRFSHGDGYSDTEVIQTIRSAVAIWPVYGGFAKARAVAACESGFDEFAYSNGNAGVFQQRLAYWAGRRDAYNRAVGERLDVAESVYNARSNVAVSIRSAHLYGWGAWSCA